MKSAELTPTAQKIDRVIKRIDEGDIKIPAFQRGFVWKQEQVIDLLESIVSEYPIGSVLLWRTESILKSTRNIAGYKLPHRPDIYPVNYTLDGQQRMASIYGVFSQNLEQEKDTGYNPDPNMFEISYDFEKEEFQDIASVTNHNTFIKLRDLLNVTTLISALKILREEYHTSAQELASQFLNYEIPMVTIENREKSDVGMIFERINNTGTKLSALDLMTAWTWTEDFHLLEACNDLLEELESKGFGKIKHKTILQVISAVVQNTTVSKNIINLSGEQVRDNWDRIAKCFQLAVDFLATDIKCLHIDFLPHTQQLIPVVKFFDLMEKPTAEQIAGLKHYFWATSFSNRYSTGQTNAKMDADIEKLVLLSNDDHAAFAGYHHSVTEAIFTKTKFSKANSTTRAFLLLMAQYEPVDLVKNQKIDIGQSLAQYNRKEYHHVFPQAFLKSKSVPKDTIFSLMNFCFLSSASNKKISKRSPSDYFFNMIPDKDYSDILNSNILPVGKEIYKNDDYDLFLQRRAAGVQSRIDELLI